MKIRFVDLAAQNLEIAERVASELEAVHSATAYVAAIRSKASSVNLRNF
jgi:hypothetical protein